MSPFPEDAAEWKEGRGGAWSTIRLHAQCHTRSADNSICYDPLDSQVLVFLHSYDVMSPTDINWLQFLQLLMIYRKLTLATLGLVSKSCMDT